MKDDAKVATAKSKIEDKHNAGVVAFWIGLFLIGIILEPLALYFFNVEERIARENGLEAKSSTAVYRIIAIILIALNIALVLASALQLWVVIDFYQKEQSLLFN